MDNNLKKMNKNQLLKIISKLKKDDLINIINTKFVGGGNNDIIRTPIVYNIKKVNKNNKNNAMANDPLYNKIFQ